MKNYTIVSFALENFDGPWLSRQFMATCLSKHANVLYVTPGKQFDTLLANIKDPKNKNNFLNRQTTINKNLVHLDPGGIYPQFFETHKTLNSWTRKLRMNSISRTVRSLGWPEEKILYVWNPEFHEAFGSLNESVSIFHCIDYFPHYFPEGSSDREKSKKNLETCLRKADIVLTTCKILEDKLAEHVDRKFTRLLHGVNATAFNSGQATVTPDELKDIPHPRLAHIGRINNKIDVNLLADIAEKNPEWSVVLMGPVVSSLSVETHAGLDRLTKLPNAYILPGKPPEELPAYFNAIDVGLLAYHMAFWVPYGLPLKYFEFLGAGKPMVCSPLDSMSEFPEYVNTAESTDSWIEAINKALADNSPAKEAERKELAAISTWDHRAVEVLGEISSIQK